MHDHFCFPPAAPPWLLPNHERSALAQVLTMVFQGHWVGQHRFTSTSELDALHAALAPSPAAHILDLGDDAGGPALYLALQTGCRVTGVRASPRLCVQAIAAAAIQANVRFVGGDVFSNRLLAHSFDGIVGYDAFVTIADKAKALAQCYQLLRPGGRLACTVMVAHGSQRPHPRNANLPPHPLPTCADYHRIAQHSGFHLIASDDLSATFCELGARWRGALCVWESDLRAELGLHGLRRLRESIGLLAEWASLGHVGHRHLVLQRD